MASSPKPHTGQPALVLKEIEVRRMPGFSRSGFTLHDLAPGVNVIFGPNGSGKTTTARAIQRLLWPETSRAPVSLFGSFSVNGQLWTIHLDAGLFEWQIDGEPAHPPQLPPADGKDRYLLSLPDLLMAYDNNFAAAIARESVGGYDIQAAAKAAGFDQPLTGKKNIPQGLREARKALDDARMRQQNLMHDEHRLDDLIRAHREAARLGAQRDVFDRLLEVIDARTAEAEAREAVARYPEWMIQLRGDEREILGRLVEEKTNLHQRLTSARQGVEEAKKSRSDTGLPETGLPEGFLSRMRALLDAVINIEQKISATEQALRAAVKTRDDVAKHLGPRVDHAKLHEMDAGDVSELTKLVESSQSLRARRKDLEAERRRLIASATEGFDVDRLRRGIQLLIEWVKTAREQKRLRRLIPLTIGAWAFAFLMCGLLAFFVHPHFVWLSIGVLVLGAVSWRLGVKSRGEGEPEAILRQYEQLGMEAPPAWTDEDVLQHVETLQRQMVLAQEQLEREKRLRAIEVDLQHLGEEEDALGQQLQRFLHPLGLAVDEEPIHGWWLIQRMSEWKQSDLEVTSLTAEKQYGDEQMKVALAEVKQLLASVGIDVPEQRVGIGARLRTIVEQLEERQSQWERVTQRLHAAEKEIETIEAAFQSVKEQRRSIFDRVGLDGDEPKDEAVLLEACEAYAQYQEARERLSNAISIRQTAEKSLFERLRDHLPENGNEAAAADDVFGRPVHAWTRAEAEEERQKAEAAQEQAVRLIEEIAKIEDRMNQAKRGNDVEAALAAYERAEEQLADLLAEECRLEIGKLLVDYVHSVTEERDRPQVFLKAREQFAKVTQGAYRLEIQSGEEPIFQARDTATNEIKSLDELSSGTRAQLLIAVRMAFVESIEGDLRLPIIFDEALANSDDVRADSLIDSVLELAAAGRQVIYFTAQADEVGKWKAALTERSHIPHSLIDLRDAKEISRSSARPLPEMPQVGRIQIPDPHDLEYEAYGRLLKVPAIDPYDDSIGGVHLWHLLDEPYSLQRFLSMSIENWGALQTLHDLGGLEHFGPWAIKAYEKAAAAARCLQAVIAAWRIGRGRPVDRQSLIESGAISETFFHSAAELAAACDYDAKRLMAAIDAGELKRFRQDNKEQLRTFFEEEGYLDYRDPLDESAMNAHVIATVGQDISEGLIDGEHVERLIIAVSGSEST